MSELRELTSIDLRARIRDNSGTSKPEDSAAWELLNTMIEERLTQCCVHVATVREGADEDGNAIHQCAPFCAVQAWAPLGERRISTATGKPKTSSTPAHDSGGRHRLPVTVKVHGEG